MKVVINGRAEHLRTVWMEGTAVKMINQPLLPHSFAVYTSRNHIMTAEAIRTMIIRGAPAIGAAGAFGVAQAALEYKGNNRESFQKYVKDAAKTLSSTRPTAHDLFHGIETVLEGIRGAKTVRDGKRFAVTAAGQYAEWSANNCGLIGEFGDKLIKSGQGILTHCNAGALACVDYGTALAPIRFAHDKGKRIHVFIDETRPRLQGANLTAWEMAMEGIPHSLICDNAAGYYMQCGEIDIVIVGADRVASNGDAANKIGTYEKAVLAKENRIPFYIAAPSSTVDLKCKSGASIPIEERSEDEVLSIQGLSGGTFGNIIKRVLIAPKGTKAKNPAFDVTPARYIRGIITERGIFKPEEVRNIKSE